MKEKKPSEIGLYLEQKNDIDQIRKDVENLMRTDLNLSHKQDMMSQKLDTLVERINEGVSKTAWNTHKDVQEIKKILIEVNSKTALMEQRVESNFVDLDRLKSWVYWIAGVGVCGGLVALAFTFAKNPPW
jgi:hypothetical protein